MIIPEVSYRDFIDIMLVSKDESRYLSNLLQQWGFKTSVMHSGSDITQYLQHNIPNLALIDAHFTEPNGTLVAEHLKRHSRFKHVPIMLLLDPFNSKVRAQAEWARPDRILYKPANDKTIHSHIRQLLLEPLSQQAGVAATLQKIA